MTIRTVLYQTRRVIYVGFVVLMLCSDLWLGSAVPANASNAAAKVVQDRAEQEFDRVAGAGTSNQIKGRATEDLGRVQRQVDKATSQTKGLTKQVEGRAQKDIGRTQSALEDAADAVEDSTDGFVDSVKNLFGQ
jgi:uncharacterized protein YjbJ (UPF0337 family)